MILIEKFNFAQQVINWYHIHGRKNLPWQKKNTLYTVWLSEIMLQQTQVKTVIPYFKKFIKQFPTIKHLAMSSLDEVLFLWSGLGYYNRAYNLFKTAKIILKNYNGSFPDNFNEIIKLPGIGKTTAGAILSLSKNFFYPILDGNIKRILIRYHNINEYSHTKKIENKLWHLINLVTPIYNTNKFNQAMMDLGALVCTTILPKCNICPLNIKCMTKRTTQSLNILKKTHDKKRTLTKSTFLIIQHHEYILLERQIQKKYWKNLFCFPIFSNRRNSLHWLQKNNIKYKINININPFKHYFSNFVLYITPIWININNNNYILKQNNNSIWYNLKDQKNIGIPTAVKKILSIIISSLNE